MKLILITLLTLIVCQPAFAEQRYNVMENRYETVSDCEDTLKYNVYEDKYSYEMENSNLEYNIYNDSYDWSMDCEEEK